MREIYIVNVDIYLEVTTDLEAWSKRSCQPYKTQCRNNRCQCFKAKLQWNSKRRKSIQGWLGKFSKLAKCSREFFERSNQSSDTLGAQLFECCRFVKMEKIEYRAVRKYLFLKDNLCWIKEFLVGFVTDHSKSDAAKSSTSHKVTDEFCQKDVQTRRHQLFPKSKRQLPQFLKDSPIKATLR